MSPRATPLAPDERRRAIVDVVVPLLLERGSAPATREIAAAAGIAEGTIFRAFPDMSALWWAVLREVLDPTAELAAIDVAAAGCDGLPATVTALAEHLQARAQRTAAAMTAIRSLGPQCRPGTDGSTGSEARRERPAPPAFLAEASAQLTSGLAEALRPYADQLAVDPSTAATVLRSLVLGTRHPGATEAAHLSTDQIVAVMLHGVSRAAATDPHLSDRED